MQTNMDKNKKTQKPVQIRKMQNSTSYRVTYDYNGALTSFIKENLPREHWKVKVESFYDPDTKKNRDVWSRDIKAFSIGRVISFLVDNNIKFEFIDLTNQEIEYLRNEFRERQNRLKKILKEKLEGLDVSNMDFDFMKKPPYEYQKQAVRFFELNGGKAILADEMGVGKAQPIYSKVSTPNGWTPIGKLSIGDEIHNRFGGVSQVIGVYPQGIQDVYRVTFSDNTYTDCNIEHLWRVRKNNKKTWLVKSLKYIIDNNIYDESNNYLWEIPITNPVYFVNEVQLPEVVQNGVLINCIPNNIKNSCKENRKQFLQKIFDSISFDNKIKLDSISEILQKDIMELVQSLGGIASVNEEFLEINVDDNVCRFIAKIELIGDSEQLCIKTSASDQTYLTDNFIVTHNTVTAFAYAAKKNLKTLIVCPSSLKLNWKREIDMFLGQKSFVYKYAPPKRSNNVNHPKEYCNFHIINYESLDTYFKYEFKHKCSSPKCKFEAVDLEKSYNKCPLCAKPKSVKSKRFNLLEFEDKQGMTLNPEDYDLIILDECHYIKNETAQRTILIKKAFKDIDKKILISGTPIKSKPIEFFSILNFLRPEEFNSSHEFGKKYCAGHEDSYGWKYDGASNLEELYERIQPFFIRRLKNDILELPPKTFVNIPIELSDKQMKDYEKVEKGVVEQLTDTSDGATKKTPLQIILELKRFVSDIKVKESIPIIKDIIEQGEKVVVFSEFQSTAEAIKDAFKDQSVMIHGGVSTDDRDKAVQDFQDPNSDVMVFSGTIGAAGVGLTLTRSSNLIFIGSAWTSGDMAQAEDRVHRASTTASKVTIMTLYCENTIDEYIMDLLQNKSQIVSKTLDNKIINKTVDTINSISQESTNNNIISDLINKLTNHRF